MTVNSSSSPLNLFYHCFDSKSGIYISTAFTIINVFLLLPLCLLVLYLGLQRWWQQRSFTSTSHSDIFTYHFAAMELIFVLGFPLYVCGKSIGLVGLMTVAYYAVSVFYIGQMSFHILTCVERYLAVVHPVTYLRLRQSGGVKIRNISIGCVWLLYCGWIGVEALYFPDAAYIPSFCFLASSLVVVSFCSISVLCVLIRPGPGEMGGTIPRVDQSKQRTFHTITAITGVLWLFFLGVCVCAAVANSHLLTYNDECLVLASGIWFSLPSSLVLPLLFLHRARKLICCHRGKG